MSKLFIDSNSFNIICTNLAKKIIHSKYKPDAILGISRGGCVPGIIIHEYLNYNNIKCQYYVMSAKSYENNKQTDKMFIDMSNYTRESLKKCNNILIVDDVFDTGLTIMNVCNYLYGLGIKSDKFKIATPYYKPKNNKTTIIPDFYKEETEEWIVFPHELIGLTEDEIKYKV